MSTLEAHLLDTAGAPEPLENSAPSAASPRRTAAHSAQPAARAVKCATAKISRRISQVFIYC